MSRYQKMFERLAKVHEGAFIPFVVLWDPDRETSKRIIMTLIDAGADALELGIAFSDPLADGPTIQKADLRALRSGSRVRDALNLVEEIRAHNDHIPIGILTYANLVFKNSLNWFYGLCHECGVDSVVVADVPLIEAKPYCDMALTHGIDPVLIAPINLPLWRCATIAQLGRGYTYVVTRKGVTGANDTISLRHRELLQELKDCGAPPSVFGFGISTPAHVKAAISEGAKGAISGSRVVSIIEEHLDDQTLMMSELIRFVHSMKDATKAI
jgi:tryptophan synthase alpha chain